MDDTTYSHAASLPNVLFGGGFMILTLFWIPPDLRAIANSLGYMFVNTASALEQMQSTDYALDCSLRLGADGCVCGQQQRAAAVAPDGEQGPQPVAEQ